MNMEKMKTAGRFRLAALVLTTGTCVIASGATGLYSTLDNLPGSAQMMTNIENYVSEVATEVSGVSPTVVTNISGAVTTGVVTRSYLEQYLGVQTTAQDMTNTVEAVVPEWARADTKPTYTASEVNALSTVGDSGFSGCITAWGSAGWEQYRCHLSSSSINQTLPAYLRSGTWNTTYGSAKFATIGDLAEVSGVTTEQATNIANAAINQYNSTNLIDRFEAVIPQTYRMSSDFTNEVLYVVKSADSGIAQRSELTGFVSSSAPVFYSATPSSWRSVAVTLRTAGENDSTFYYDSAAGHILFDTSLKSSAGIALDAWNDLRLTSSSGEYLDYLPDYVWRVATNAVHQTDERQYALFIISLNDDTTSRTYSDFELKGGYYQSATHSSVSTYDMTVQFYGSSESNGEPNASDNPTWAYDWFRLYVLHNTATNDGKVWRRFRNTDDLGTYKPTAVAVLIDPTWQRMGSSGSSWLTMNNDNLVWCYRRSNGTSFEADTDTGAGFESDTSQWRPTMPVRWYKTLPAWADQTTLLDLR